MYLEEKLSKGVKRKLTGRREKGRKQQQESSKKCHEHVSQQRPPWATEVDKRRKSSKEKLHTSPSPRK